MMKQYYLLAGIALCALVACDDNVGETIQSSYVENVWQEPEYKFSRNGSSSVDLQPCLFLKDPIDYFYESFLKKANLKNEAAWTRARSYYEDGEYGLKPKEVLSNSPVHRNNREKVVADFDRLIDASKRIAGYDEKGSPEKIRNREAAVGQSGYIGLNIADQNILFADENGFIVSEQFRFAIMGAIYLDQLLNYHLNEEVIFSDENCRAHDNLELLAGRNYTQVEHHLDLAKGYYEFWKPLTASDGMLALKDTDRKILYAFVEARRLLIRSQYDLAKEQIRIIKKELSKVVGVRVMSTLLGPNTLVNVAEDTSYAFGFLSQAWGLMYALQFTWTAEGTPYFTYEEVQALLADLESDGGLWNKERLLAGEEVKGSLKNLASIVGTKFGLSLKDIER